MNNKKNNKKGMHNRKVINIDLDMVIENNINKVNMIEEAMGEGVNCKETIKFLLNNHIKELSKAEKEKIFSSKESTDNFFELVFDNIFLNILNSKIVENEEENIEVPVSNNNESEENKDTIFNISKDIEEEISSNVKDDIKDNTTHNNQENIENDKEVDSEEEINNENKEEEIKNKSLLRTIISGVKSGVSYVAGKVCEGVNFISKQINKGINKIKNIFKKNQPKETLSMN